MIRFARKLVVQFGNLLPLDFANCTTSKARHNVELSNTLVLARGTRFSLRLDMLCHELVEHGGQALIGLRLVAITCRIASKSDLSEQPLSLKPGSGGRQLSVLADSDAPRAALASANPVLNEIDLPARRCDFETKARKLIIPEVCIFRGRMGRIHGPFGNASGLPYCAPPLG